MGDKKTVSVAIPPSVGGRLGGGHIGQCFTNSCPHPGPPPNGEGMDRHALLAEMQEPFRGQARENLALYQELCGAMPDDAALENGMKLLWLHSVTDGGESYTFYLVSPLWKRISQEVLLRDGHACAACAREAEVVHHRSYAYEVMAGLDDSRLVSLCNPCHRHIHFDGLRKTMPSVWEKRLKALQKKRSSLALA